MRIKYVSVCKVPVTVAGLVSVLHIRKKPLTLPILFVRLRSALLPPTFTVMLSCTPETALFLSHRQGPQDTFCNLKKINRNDNFHSFSLLLSCSHSIYHCVMFV